jgi:putative transposase
MRKSRFTERQIVSILREHDAGTTFVELGRKHGVHPNTVAAWKAKYGDMDATELARSKAIEDENARMRRIISNLTLENNAMKTLIEKKLLEPSQRKEAVRVLEALGLSQRARAN